MFGTYRKIWQLLNGGQRPRFAILVAMTFVMGVLDLAGVAAVLPFLAVLADPSVIEQREGLGAVYRGLGFETVQAFLPFLGLIVFAVVIASIAFRALTFYYVTRFTRGVGLVIAERLLTRYLAHPYEWHLTRHSSDLTKSVLNEVNQVVTGSLAPAMRTIANGVVTVFLIGLLVVVEPLGAIVTALLVGSAFGLLYLRLRGPLARIGESRKEAMRERFQTLQEAMTGIKEVKMLGLERGYIDKFRGPTRRLVDHQATLSLIGDMPRYGLEAIGFGGMLLFVLWLLWSRDGALAEVLPLIGAFAFAGLKLMPTAQLLFKDVSAMRFGQPMLDALHRDLQASGPKLRPRAGPTPLPLRRAVALEGVSYTYPGADGPALHDLSLTIEARSSVGFVGTTGAGKTTVVDVLLGLLQPTAGALVVDGVPVEGAALRAWQANVGYVPQTVYLVDDTVAANIAFGAAADEIDEDAVRRAGRQASLEAFVSELPDGYRTRVGEAGVKLSGGQRQRIAIARALYRDPDVIVFDEATSALDTVTERTVMEAVGALSGSKTVIIITHRLSTVASCDRVFVMRNGRLRAQGTYDELARSSEDFADLLAGAAA